MNEYLGLRCVEKIEIMGAKAYYEDVGWTLYLIIPCVSETFLMDLMKYMTHHPIQKEEIGNHLSDLLSNVSNIYSISL